MAKKRTVKRHPNENKVTAKSIHNAIIQVQKEYKAKLNTLTTVKQFSKIVTGDLLVLRESILKDTKDSKDQRPLAIQKLIIGRFKKDPNGFEVDEIIEAMTRFGAAPQLVYDDNGLFAVTENCFAPAVSGTQKMEGTMAISVTKDMWKKTIREALNYYLKQH